MTGLEIIGAAAVITGIAGAGLMAYVIITCYRNTRRIDHTEGETREEFYDRAIEDRWMKPADEEESEAVNKLEEIGYL